MVDVVAAVGAAAVGLAVVFVASFLLAILKPILNLATDTLISAVASFLSLMIALGVVVYLYGPGVLAAITG